MYPAFGVATRRKGTNAQQFGVTKKKGKGKGFTKGEKPERRWGGTGGSELGETTPGSNRVKEKCQIQTGHKK